LRGRRGGTVVLIGSIFASATIVAVASIAYLLQPRWSETPAPADVPPLPIVVAGVVFNVPPAAIRIPMQRRAGPQERIDLAYLWPDLTPPDGTAAASMPRLFVTIEGAQPTLAPAERLKTIYPRYTDVPSAADPDGLTIASFRDGTPYQGEDVIYESSAPDRFLVRCGRTRGDLTLATCLYERAVGAAALTFRFPRDWLADWHAVEGGIDRLIERWRPTGKPT
jgi:hypothetical protein